LTVLRFRGPWLALAAVSITAMAAACGGGSGATGGGGTTGPTSRPTGSGGPRPGGFADSAQFQKIRECLTAAGISLPSPSGGFRSGTRAGPPSGSPSGPRPSGSFPAGGNRMFDDPKVQAALKACGITIPTGGPSGGPTSSPIASSTG
jgi:hypothetical protein